MEIVDDCPIFVLGLQEILSLHDMVVVATENRLPEQPHESADVMLVSAEVFPGQEEVRELDRLAQSCPIVVLTPDRLSNRAPAYIRAGAAAVVSRQQQPEAILAAIRSSIAGRCAPVGATARPAGAAVGKASGSGNALSGREEQVLSYIAWGLTHDQAARRLGISRHTVDTYVKRIRSKLGLGNKAELTRAAVLHQGVLSAAEPVSRPAP